MHGAYKNILEVPCWDYSFVLNNLYGGLENRTLVLRSAPLQAAARPKCVYVQACNWTCLHLPGAGPSGRNLGNLGLVNCGEPNGQEDG